MTAELVRGQNHPLPARRLEIRISTGKPVVAGATLNDERGLMREPDWIAHPARPNLPGLEVPRQAAADHRLAVDLEALPEAVHRVNVLLALPTGVGGPATFATLASPFVAVTGLDGTEIASYTVIELTEESAVVALELYRRNDAWKVRAVGQGYAGGLAAMLADQGLPQAEVLATTINEAVAAGMARSVAPPPRSEGDRARRGATVGGARGAVDPRTVDPRTGSPNSAAGPSGSPAGESAHTTEPGGAEPDTTGRGAAPASGGPINYQHPRRKKAEPRPSGPDPRTAPAPETTAAPGGGGAGQAGQHQPVAGDAPGWSPEERLYNQVWGMFEDLARSTAAYRSAVDFAESRMEQELDKVLSDPRSRVGDAADAARTEARAKHNRLVDEARAVLERDVAQLMAESEVVEPALPHAFARWDNPCWQGYRVPMESPMAMRLGDLSLGESALLRIPMLVRLPLERGLWIDSGRGSGVESSLVDSGELRRLAGHTATAIVARLLAVNPVGDFTVHIIDPAGSAAESLAPLLGSGALRELPVPGPEGVRQTLEKLTRRVDLVQMAVRSGATDSLPPDLDTAEQLLVVHDFPHGFDDRAVTQLRYLADEGPAVGVNLLMVADREDARAYGPVLDPLWRTLLRLSPVPDDHLADPWVGHAWTYEPPLPPEGSEVLLSVLRKVAAAREAYGH
ncbi:export associated protein [Streptomyces sp. AJS327]|uniref:TerD family protein n=1 Tax=Streptomyces sp. AJS327 TaxID=2545265 RepID=UPI0015DDD90C|nr:TerD family protein [Streptomyces sp. AJS327]MBA0050426.1 export associated protein [Streptomyces sp. AJS327]